MRCRCDTELDPFAKQLTAAVICAALAPTEYLVFRKTEWIEDCGFYFGETLVELPRGFNGKKAKDRCFTECLALLAKGWNNEIAERNRDMMLSYLENKQEIR